MFAPLFDCATEVSGDCNGHQGAAVQEKIWEGQWVITSGGVLMRDSANNLLGARLSGFNFIRFINQLRPKMMIPH